MSAKRLLAPEIPGWLAAMLPFERYAIEIDGMKLHVMEQGSGQPVLMLHGNPTWGFLYRKIAAELRNSGLRLVMPDLIGLGLSHKPRESAAHTLFNHARWISELLDALELDRMIFVGQDWGGPIGLRAIADKPERLRGLVVLNTVVTPPREGFRPTKFHRFARMPVISDLVFRGFGFPQNAIGRAGGTGKLTKDEERAYRWPLRRLADRTAPLALARMVPNEQSHPSIAELEKCRSLVEGFRGPSAIVWGERDPVLGRLRRHTERTIPDARVTITQAGHFLQEQVPREIAAAVRDVAQR